MDSSCGDGGGGFFLCDESSACVGRNILMGARILRRTLAGRLAISAGGMTETGWLLGASDVIGEDTVIAVYQHGEQ